MKMEFSFTQAPMCHHLHSVYRGDDPDNPAPSSRLLRPCSTLRNLSPRSAAPSNACEDSGTLAEDDGMSGLSVSSPTDLYSGVENTLYAYVHGPCSLPLSEYEHPHCCISESAIHGSVSGYHPATLHSGTSSPTPGDMSNCLLYVLDDDSWPCHKDTNLYRNLSRRNELRGFNPIVG